MRVYLYYLAGFLNMPSAQVPVLCIFSLSLSFFFSFPPFFFSLVLCLFLYFRVCLMWTRGGGGSTLAEEKAERERERERLRRH